MNLEKRVGKLEDEFASALLNRMSFAQTRAWSEVRAVILKALRSHKDARLAVEAALARQGALDPIPDGQLIDATAETGIGWDYLAVREAVQDALKGFANARQAVVDALGAFAEEAA